MTLRDVRSPGFDGRSDAPAVALLLHGFGSHEHDLADLAPALGLAMPWASLRAPIELGDGAAWFAITTQPEDFARGNDFDNRSRIGVRFGACPV